MRNICIVINLYNSSFPYREYTCINLSEKLIMICTEHRICTVQCKYQKQVLIPSNIRINVATSLKDTRNGTVKRKLHKHLKFIRISFLHTAAPFLGLYILGKTGVHTVHLHAYMKQFTSPYLHLICMETICLLFYWDNNQNFYIPFSFSSLQRGQTTPLPKHSESPSPNLLYILSPLLSS